mgnify:CR=1 FL=1
MSYNYNHCTLVGHISNEPEFKQVTESFCKLVFTIAVNRPYRKDNGESEADFIPVLFTGNLAHIGQNLLTKGTALLVWGAINVRSYEKDNIRRWITELSAENFQILRKGKKEGGKSSTSDTLKSDKKTVVSS